MLVFLSSGSSVVVSGSLDKTVRIWNLEDGDCKHTITDYFDFITSVRLFNDGTLLASGTAECTVLVHEVSSLEKVGTDQVHTGAIKG